MKYPGTIVAIGGGEDKTGDRIILRKFVEVCGGTKANIVTIPAATQESEHVGEQYTKIFKALGAGKAHFIDLKNREDTTLKKSLEAMDAATGVFFTGGDQLLITTLIGGSIFEKKLHECHKNGLVIGGTSAGAAMMANSMIVRGETNAVPQFGSVEIGPGLDFLPGAIIDTHFSERGRFGRLLLAVAHYPQDLGLGIDRNTALILKGKEFEVIGEGVVYVIDAGNNIYSNLVDITRGGTLSIFDVKVHLVSNEHRFNMIEKKPVLKLKKNGVLTK